MPKSREFFATFETMGIDCKLTYLYLIQRNIACIQMEVSYQIHT